MAAIKLLAVLLTVLNVAATKVPKEPASCLNPVVCPCGTTGKNVTFCSEDEQEEDICDQWSDCKACQNGFKGCLECLEGFLCSKGNEVQKPLRQKRYYVHHPPEGFSNQYFYLRPMANVVPRISTCADPGIIANGIRRNPDASGLTFRRMFKEGESLIYECTGEYILQGSTLLTCLNNGRWSSSLPRCLRPITSTTAPISCPNPASIPYAYMTSNYSQLNGQRGPSDAMEYLPGSRVEYTCYYGYILEGSRSLICQNTGLWSSEAPVCRPEVRDVFCEDPGIDVNGDREPRSMPGDAGWPALTLLQYSCSQGYDLEGEDTLYCLSGNWTSERPSCVPIGCGRVAPQKKPAGAWMWNGFRVRSGEWPWVVAIGVQRNSYDHLICAGALLDRSTVITAAHCLSRGGPYTLYFGKHYRDTDRDEASVERRTVDEIIIHPDFRNETLDSDIALVKFAPPVDYSRLVRAVCLPTAETAARHLASGSVGGVIGWGFNEKQVESEEVMSVYLPYVNNSACEQSLREFVPESGPLLTQNMFCAGFPDARQTTCKGDSGSPMVFYDLPSNRYTLEGLVSFSVRGQCGLPGRYSVFTRVYRFLPWIIENM